MYINTYTNVCVYTHTLEYFSTNLILPQFAPFCPAAEAEP